VEVKRLFSTTSETEIFSKSSWIETKVNGGHWGDRTLNRTRSRLTGRVRSVAAAVKRGSLGFCTYASGHSRDQRIRLRQRDNERGGLIGHGGASGHDRPNTSGHVWMLTGIDRTLALWCLVSSSNTSGRVVSNANQQRPDA
jgi:hypothetical protein